MGKEVWGGERGDPMRSRVPMNRFCEISEVINAVMFYLSDLASFCTATKLLLDGGMRACNTLRTAPLDN